MWEPQGSRLASSSEGFFREATGFVDDFRLLALAPTNVLSLGRKSSLLEGPPTNLDPGSLGPWVVFAQVKTDKWSGGSVLFGG